MLHFQQQYKKPGGGKTSMAAASLIDVVLDRVISRLVPMLHPFLALIKRHPLAVGLVIGLPWLLFVLLASVTVCHWWHFPWSEQGTLWLFRWMTLGAVVDTLIYGLVSLMFFLTWWRKKLHVSKEIRPRLALTYTFAPLFYGSVAAWGIASLSGQQRSLFACAAVAVFMLMGIGQTRLRLLEKNTEVESRSDCWGRTVSDLKTNKQSADKAQ